MSIEKSDLHTAGRIFLMNLESKVVGLQIKQKSVSTKVDTLLEQKQSRGIFSMRE